MGEEFWRVHGLSILMESTWADGAARRQCSSTHRQMTAEGKRRPGAKEEASDFLPLGLEGNR
jgi:hypothetical protein